MAITLAEPRDRQPLRQVERATGRRITVGRVPTTADLKKRRLDRLRDALRDTLQAGGLDEFRGVVEGLAGEFAPEDVALAAVALAVRGRPVADGPDIPAVADDRSGARERATHNHRAEPRDRRPGREMTRVFVGAGREAGVGRRDLLAAFGDMAGLGPREIGSIDVADRFSLVEVPGELLEYAVDALQGVRLKGRAVPVRQDRSWPGRGRVPEFILAGVVTHPAEARRVSGPAPAGVETQETKADCRVQEGGVLIGPTAGRRAGSA
ncbi:MAG: DbpA RNA binding domain-containing protein [Gemmataceae bacterium]